MDDLTTVPCLRHASAASRAPGGALLAASFGFRDAGLCFRYTRLRSGELGPSVCKLGFQLTDALGASLIRTRGIEISLQLRDACIVLCHLSAVELELRLGAVTRQTRLRDGGRLAIEERRHGSHA
jgi:hypothetical protein